MTSWTRTILVAVALIGEGAAHSESRRFEYTQVHMGMPVRIVLYAPDDRIAVRSASAAFARIAELDRDMSDYRPDSVVSDLARAAPAAVVVSRDVFRVVSRAIEIARASGGAFDPTSAPIVALWREARRTGRLPDRSAIERARALVGWQRVDLDAGRTTIRLSGAGMRVDLGGIAKGYILQEALTALRAEGTPRALVEAGGDVVVGDAPPDRAGWRIDVHVSDALFRARASALVNAALSTSGPSAQFVEIGGTRYSHVIDPRTGDALTTATMAHVIAPDGATADALATAAVVLGVARLSDLQTRFPDAQIALGSTWP